MKASEVIREAKSVLLVRGRTLHYTQAHDGSVCLLGALGVARTGDAYSGWGPKCLEEFNDLSEAVGRGNVVAFNNNATFDEAMDALDSAEKIAELRESDA